MLFLKAAQAVEVACVVDRSELPASVAGAKIAPHLSRHGVAVMVMDLPVVGNVAEILRQTAEHGRADMIVLGAYGRSRIRERILGGVTQFRGKGLTSTTHP